MPFLQAAMGYGLLIAAIFGGAIFIGIPILTLLLFDHLKNGRTIIDANERFKLRMRSLVIAIIVISIILFLICVFFLSKIDLTYS